MTRGMTIGEENRIRSGTAVFGFKRFGITCIFFSNEKDSTQPRKSKLVYIKKRPRHLPEKNNGLQ